jgi:hypothetical protein
VGYSIRIGNNGQGQFHFDVDANGVVSSQNPDAATGNANTLTFNNTIVNVDPVAYSGPYRIIEMGTVPSGYQSFVLVPGVGYSMRVGNNSRGQFHFALDASGNVTSLNTDAANGVNNTLVFNNTTINVDPVAYAGPYRIVEMSIAPSGYYSFVVVPGVGYSIRVGNNGRGQFHFTVDTVGNITSLNTDAAIGVANTLVFNNTSINVDPGAYSGIYRIIEMSTAPSGYQSFVVVPAVGYSIRVANNSRGQFHFTVDAGGNVTSLNTDAATSTGNTLQFRTTTITVDPGSYAGYFRVIEFASSIGETSYVLVPGVSYTLRVNATNHQNHFTVAEPCAVSPAALVIDNLSFAISCGQPDSDNDGVPDDTDNCPAIANPDQLDQDLDGTGNLCDADLDGDSVSNNLDNCPAIANSDQADLDLDGQGDACETDTDGDTVTDDFPDNCLLVANTDQADSDADLLGDACDEDDDNDGVDDVTDNCPYSANLDQADFNANGQGDVCDNDIDGDNVANPVDLCPLSPLNLPANTDGCTGAQYIGLNCEPVNFAKHGQYVSCVAHAAKDAANSGLISNQEKARFVKQAAQSN